MGGRSSLNAMAPHLTEDEIDDLVYFSRAGENADLDESLAALAEREKASLAEILLVAKDEGKSSTLHMATGNGHLGMSLASLFSGQSYFTEPVLLRAA